MGVEIDFYYGHIDGFVMIRISICLLVTTALLLSVLVVGSVQAKIGTSDIQNGAVTNPKIANNSVNSTQIQSQAVISGNIHTNTITDSNMATGSVSQRALQQNSVTTSKIQDGSITGSKIDNNAVNTTNLVNASVTTAKLADNSVTTSKLASGSVSAAKTTFLTFFTIPAGHDGWAPGTGQANMQISGSDLSFISASSIIILNVHDPNHGALAANCGVYDKFTNGFNTHCDGSPSTTASLDIAVLNP